MNDLLLLEKYFPGGKLEGGINLANQLDWALSVQTSGEGYVVSSGGQPILRTETKEALQSFIYGLGLAYAVLPDRLFNSLTKSLKEF